LSRSRRSRPQERSRQDQPELVWRKIDLHIHTPASADYQDTGISSLDILRRAEARGADLIAFTDHNSVRGYANLWRDIEDLELLEALERLTPAEQRRLEEYRRLLTKIRVLPGFEFTATFGFHILAIFPEGTAIRMLEHLLLELNVPDDKLDLGSGEVGATTDVLRAYEIMANAGALVIPAHVNSTHGVAMQNLPFGGQTKIAFTQSPFIVALEATDLESTSRRSTAKFFNGSKPEYARRMHIIQGSDAHRLNRDPNRETNLGIGDRMTEVQIAEVSFRGLAELFRSDYFNHVRPYRPMHDPYDFIRTARSEGDTIVQAFHEQPPTRRGRLSPIVRDVVALANVNGGTIFVGLSGNPKDPVVGLANAQEQVDIVAEDIARHVVPPLQVALDLAASDNKQVLVITVPSGADKPYAVAPGTIYVRQEGESATAMRDEIVQLVRAGVAASEGQLPELVPAATPSPTTTEPSAEPTPLSSRSRRARGRRRGSHPAETTASATAGHAEEGAASAVAATPPGAESEDSVLPPISGAPAADANTPYPRTGVEIAACVARDGVNYYSMRDLRNLKVVQNVTRDSARRLWRYAITQQESHTLKPEQVAWDGARGFWKAYKQRGGDVRYNLVYRDGADDMHVFYGVTDEGMDDNWRGLIPESVLRFVAGQTEQAREEPSGTQPEDVASLPEPEVEALPLPDQPAAPPAFAPLAQAPAHAAPSLADVIAAGQAEVAAAEVPADPPVEALPAADDSAPAEVAPKPRAVRPRKSRAKPKPPADETAAEAQATTEPSPTAAPESPAEPPAPEVVEAEAPKPKPRRRRTTKPAADATPEGKDV
jgi:hypothetical protein